MKMVYYDRIDVSKRIDVNKTSASKEFDIFRYWYFLNKGFRFQKNVCNNLNDFALLKIKGLPIAVLLLELAKMKL